MRERLSSSDRIHRLLAILRYAAEHPTGVPIDDLVIRFGMRRDQLERDLEMAMMIGADSPDYHDMPFEVLVDADRVHCRLFGLERPLRLTPEEALVLTASTEALTRDEPEGSPLRRALAKIATQLGLAPGEAIGVDLSVLGGPTGQLIDEAIRAGRAVAFRYWAHGTDTVETRTVDPWRLFTAEGSWYLTGLDHRRGEQRRFRLDRIADPRVLPEEMTAPVPDEVDTTVRLDDAATATLDIERSGRWILDSLTLLDLEELDDGWVRITVPVVERIWLERLVLRLGGAVRIVHLDPTLGSPDVVADAATRVLRRYRASDRAR